LFKHVKENNKKIISSETLKVLDATRRSAPGGSARTSYTL